MSFVFVQVLRIDIKAQKAELVGPVLDGVGSQKFISGSVCGPDGCLYFIPCRESQVLKLDPAKGSFTKIGQEFAQLGRVAVKKACQLHGHRCASDC